MPEDSMPSQTKLQKLVQQIAGEMSYEAIRLMKDEINRDLVLGAKMRQEGYPEDQIRQVLLGVKPPPK